MIGSTLLTALAFLVAAQDEGLPPPQNEESYTVEIPHSVVAFGIRSENDLGVAHNVTDLRAGRLEAIADCEENSGGEQCIMAMAYPQCGAVAELQLGRELGNPVAWGPDERQAIDLRTAMDQAMATCSSGIRDFARQRFADDEAMSARVEVAHCAIVYYHCTDWDDADDGASPE